MFASNDNYLSRAMGLSIRYIIKVWAVVIGAVLLSLGCINDADETAEETTLVKIGQQAPDFTVEMSHWKTHS